MSQSSNPPVTIQWRENDHRVSSRHIKINSFDGENYGAKVQSTVKLTARKSMNGHVVTCVTEFDGILLKSMSKQYTLNIMCKYLCYIKDLYYYLLLNYNTHRAALCFGQ